ncbi:MAG TPA: OsmC family protein [bacterium]|nr:OsmC family protein [bacterium]
MHIYFPGGKKVFAEYKGFTIETDQPVESGGENSAPSPFDLFVTAIGTCAGFYVLGFCQQRNIPTAGITLNLEKKFDQTKGMIGEIAIIINLPKDFPPQYREAVIRAAELCAVKKHIADPPAFTIDTQIAS